MIDYNKIISEYLPDKNERDKLKIISSEIINGINLICKNENIDASPVEVGSVSKKTNLKCSDIDIFITFDKKYSKDFIERKGVEIGHKILKNGVEKYAEHPYVSGSIENIKIDIVPAFKINKGEKIVSTVDRTPLHTLYVNENTNENMIKDILLLKIFMKKVNVYGSEVSKSGFSGYLCELLIINYGNFDNVIKKFANLKGKLIIPEDKSLENKFNEPVIIIDPVDPTRNAGAAVSIENLSRIEIASKLFISGIDVFNFKNNIIINKDRKTVIKVFVLKKPDIINDILYPQVVRLKNKIWEIMEMNKFIPLSWEIDIKENIEILIEYERDIIPLVSIHMGPPAESNESIKFINAWKNNKRLLRGPYILNNRLYVDIKNKYTKFEDFFNNEIKNMDIGKNINDLKNNIKIIDVNENTDMNVIDKFYSKCLFN